QHLGRGLAPQLQPAHEVLGSDRRLATVHGHRIAAIAGRAQRHRTPERGEQALVFGPVVHGGVEDRTDGGIGAHLVVEAIDQGGDAGFVQRAHGLLVGLVVLSAEAVVVSVAGSSSSGRMPGVSRSSNCWWFTAQKNSATPTITTKAVTGINTSRMFMRAAPVAVRCRRDRRAARSAPPRAS